jgi:hypothetical protein
MATKAEFTAILETAPEGGYWGTKDARTLYSSVLIFSGRKGTENDATVEGPPGQDEESRTGSSFAANRDFDRGLLASQ